MKMCLQVVCACEVLYKHEPQIWSCLSSVFWEGRVMVGTEVGPHQSSSVPEEDEGLSNSS